MTNAEEVSMALYPTGEQAYRVYADRMMAFVASKGGRVIWMGRVDSQVIGTGGEDFDMVALVEYPSRKAFLEIVSDRRRVCADPVNNTLAGEPPSVCRVSPRSRCANTDPNAQPIALIRVDRRQIRPRDPISRLRVAVFTIAE